MLKRCVSFFLVIFSCQFFFAIDFSIEPYFSYSFGTLEKALFLSDTGDKVSDLIWENNDIFGMGLKSSCSYMISKKNKFKQKIGCLLNLDFGIPFKCGNMYDSDYYNVLGEEIKCNYAIFDNTDIANLKMEFSLFYLFNIYNYFEITPQMGAEYNYNSFEAKYVYGRYGRSEHSKTGENVPYYSSDARVPRKVGNIEMDRHSVFLWLGLKLGANISSAVEFNGGFFISPYTYIYTIDRHFKNDSEIGYTQKEFTHSNFLFYKWMISQEIKVNEVLLINAGIQWVYGKSEKGTVLNNQTGKMLEYLDYSCDSSLFMQTIWLGCKVIF